MNGSGKILLILACLGCVLLTVHPAWSSDAEAALVGDGMTAQALGNKVAGSYLLDLVQAGPAVPFRGLMTLTSDGTAILTETTDFGFGNPAVFGLNSPSHGAWKKTARREVSSSMLFFNYLDDGTLNATIRVRATWSFDQSYDSLVGPFTLEVFTPAQDPLDPSSVPVAVIHGDMTGRRIGAD